jgi:capping protein beta
MEFLSALNIVGRLPPSEVDSVVANLNAISPNVSKFLMSRVDGRLQVLTDESTGKVFIASDFNRIRHTHRSPWSNHYLPPDHGLLELYYPPESLRRIELILNELLLSYCNLYYDNAVGSCYLSEDSDSETIFGVFLVKKDHRDSHLKEYHCWESSHTFRVVKRVDDENVHIQCFMTSGVLVSFEFGDNRLPGDMDGSASRSSERCISLSRKDGGLIEEEMIRVLGELMEESENSLRGSMDKLFIPRCVDLGMASLESANETQTDSSSENIEDDFRPRVSLGTMNPLHRQSIRPEPAFQADLMGAIMQRRLKDDQLGGS